MVALRLPPAIIFEPLRGNATLAERDQISMNQGRQVCTRRIAFFAVDFDQELIEIHNSKGDKSRFVPLPKQLVEPLRRLVAAAVVKRVEVVTGVVGDDVETRVEMVKRVELVNRVEKRASEIPIAERRSTLNEPIGESYTSSECAVLQLEGEVSLEGTQTIGGNWVHRAKDLVSVCPEIHSGLGNTDKK